ncbi:MAG TPA: tail fiber protein [Pyrinomonadaceae bacterium]|nr:tail fiber protein [Pyrinomonadaceae bacterium]
MSFNFAPKGWAMCNGQFLPINQNQALFSLLGTTYGGNGQTTFALPDFRARVPLHEGQGFTLGQAGGQSAHTITMSEMPQHIHLMSGSGNNGDTVLPVGSVLGAGTGVYAGASNMAALAPDSVTNVGGSQAHENRQPFLVLNFCIALIGIFPSQN